MDETAADYPNYATALAVSALVKANGTTKPYDGGLGRGADDEIIGKMVAQLRAQQFSEANGWSPRDAAYGGWGMGGPIHHPPEAGHVDLSMTRHVLEALRASGVASSDPAISRALTYLQRSQNPDGGFYFSPVNPEINKAGEIAYGPDNRGPKKVSGSSAPAVIRRPSNNKPARSSDAGVAADGEPQPPAQDSKHFASYGTTTADGILAWRAAGVLDDDPRITKALDWLKQHHQRDRVPGFADGAGQPWALGLRFYYAHAISRCLPELTVYLPQQSPDGSYRNPVNLVKEDDPLIATTFALYALNSSRA
jgi:hypothetical protein